MEKKVTFFKVVNTENAEMFTIRPTKKQAEELKEALATFGVIANIEKDSKTITI